MAKGLCFPEEPRGALCHRMASQADFGITKPLTALIRQLHNASLGKESLRCEFAQKKARGWIKKKKSSVIKSNIFVMLWFDMAI